MPVCSSACLVLCTPPRPTPPRPLPLLCPLPCLVPVASGVAFSKSIQSNADNIGYIIPYCVVEHFLSEYLAHGSYNGIVGVGFFTQVGGWGGGGRQAKLSVGYMRAAGKPRHSMAHAGAAWGSIGHSAVCCVCALRIPQPPTRLTHTHVFANPPPNPPMDTHTHYTHTDFQHAPGPACIACLCTLSTCQHTHTSTHAHTRLLTHTHTAHGEPRSAALPQATPWCVWLHHHEAGANQ